VRRPICLTEEQLLTDLDFQQSLAQLFTLVPYGQLVLEQAELTRTPSEVVDVVFEWLVRDFNAHAVEFLGKASPTEAQRRWAVNAVRKPAIDAARDERIYAEVRALADADVMPD
jgi:acyl-CoA dehydrogenase